MCSWFLLYTLERVSLKPRKKENENSSYLFNNSSKFLLFKHFIENKETKKQY